MARNCERWSVVLCVIGLVNPWVVPQCVDWVFDPCPLYLEQGSGRVLTVVCVYPFLQVAEVVNQ